MAARPPMSFRRGSAKAAITPLKASPLGQGAGLVSWSAALNPASFPDCGGYLGDLYSHRTQGTAAAPGAPAPAAGGGGNAGTGTQTRSDRFGN